MHRILYFCLLPFQFVETTDKGELEKASMVSNVVNTTKGDYTFVLGNENV